MQGKPKYVLSDMRERARRRLPRFAFDFLDGGAGDENGMHCNRASYASFALRPRYMADVDNVDPSAKLFGSDWKYPFGVAPIGYGNLFWPGTERTIAEAAVANGIPYTLSSTASTPIESIGRMAGKNGWFQLYTRHEVPIVEDIIDRAAGAGYGVLVVTVDVPVSSRVRYRDIRNRLTHPFRFTPSVVWQLMTHPQWSLAQQRAGIPSLANYQKYYPGLSAREIAGRMEKIPFESVQWPLIKKIRDRWKGHLTLKGVLAAEDAVQAKAIGCDGIVISNHGGRALSALPPPLEVLPEIRAAVGPEFPLLVDSGVRTGEDIAKALALGADFVLCGRAIMYAAAALGAEGGRFAIESLAAEFRQCLGQIGKASVAELKADPRVILKRQFAPR